MSKFTKILFSEQVIVVPIMAASDLSEIFRPSKLLSTAAEKFMNLSKFITYSDKNLRTITLNRNLLTYIWGGGEGGDILLMDLNRFCSNFDFFYHCLLIA